jgi:8-oxo-dGTP diphosphatase
MLNFDDRFSGKTENVEYMERKCACAVIRNAEGKFAFVEVSPSGHLYLLGGGMDEGEIPEQTIIRESMEEAGAAVRVGKKIGEAGDYMFARLEKIYIHKTTEFFEAALEEIKKPGIEPDHKLVWLTLEEAKPHLRQQGHIWAIEQILAR